MVIFIFFLNGRDYFIISLIMVMISSYRLVLSFVLNY